MRAFVIAGRWFLILALCSMMALFATTLASLCLPAHSFLRTGLDIEAALLFTGLALTVLCNLRITFLHQRSAATDSGREHAVLAPTTGRWVALNSPASKVPSHNWLLGQAYAIDLVAAPSRQEVSEGAIARPDFFRGSPFKPPRAYPAFGMPVRAMVDGVVVSSEDRYRDHRARSRWIGFIYLMAEDAIRSLGPVGWLLGNHVTIRTDSGIYALVAHLQHGSIRVKVVSGSAPARSSAGAATPGTPASRTCTPSSWTVPSRRWPSDYRSPSSERGLSPPRSTADSFRSLEAAPSKR